MDIQQKNDLLKVFLSQFKSKELAESYAIENNVADYHEVINELERVTNDIYDHIWKITEPDKKLLAFEIEQVCASYCLTHYQWVNEVGLKALNSWLLWMCWHEGILKKTEV